MDKRLEILKEVGRIGLNTLYPTEFEYYIVIFELVNSEGKTVEYLSFPVNPDSISYDDEVLSNVRKTLGGVSVVDNGTSRPKKISMSGTFGRKLRLLLDVNTNSTSNGTKDGSFLVPGNSLEIKTNVFNARLKTGYGTIRILKSIIEKSVQLDEYDKPHRVYLYFPPLGENYLIKFQTFKLTQDYSTSNMLWKYMINLSVLGELDSMVGNTSLSSRELKLQSVQRGLNILLNKIGRML